MRLFVVILTFFCRLSRSSLLDCDKSQKRFWLLKLRGLDRTFFYVEKCLFVPM
jgi:hypothetical protein